MARLNNATTPTYEEAFPAGLVLRPIKTPPRPMVNLNKVARKAAAVPSIIPLEIPKFLHLKAPPPFTISPAVLATMPRPPHVLDRQCYSSPVLIPTIKQYVHDELPSVREIMLISDIQRLVAMAYGVRLMDLLSSRRTKELVMPRHVGMWLCKILTFRSFPEIGRRFGRRDHTTALYAFRKIDALYRAGNLELPPDVAAHIPVSIAKPPESGFDLIPKEERGE